MKKPNSVLRWSKSQTVNLFGDAQETHVTANFVIKGVGVKTLTALVTLFFAFILFSLDFVSISYSLLFNIKHIF